MSENHTIERYRQERDEQYRRRVEAEEELARVKKEQEELIAELDVKHDKLVRLSDKFRATVSSIDQKDAALKFARPIVEKWCHYQGNTKELFDEYLGPIDAALHHSGKEVH